MLTCCEGAGAVVVLAAGAAGSGGEECAHGHGGGEPDGDREDGHRPAAHRSTSSCSAIGTEQRAHVSLTPTNVWHVAMAAARIAGESPGKRCGMW